MRQHTATRHKFMSEGVDYIFLHRIEWRVEAEDVELDETSIEHIQDAITNGFLCGELNVSIEDGDYEEASGWWEISNSEYVH